MKVAIYCRVSTVYQVDKDSLPMQKHDLISYAELMLGVTDYEIFEDAGYSGKNTDRPAFQDMLQRLRKGEFTHLLVWKIDRISRNVLDFSRLYDELKKLHVTFVSKSEQFDTSTAMGEAMLKIILVFAELERQMTSERVTATMISRASLGKWNGGRIPYGYGYNPDANEFFINPDEKEVCLFLKDTYLRTRSLLSTARIVNEKGMLTRAGIAWSPTTICTVVKSPFYYGAYRYNFCHVTDKKEKNPASKWILVENHHPAIFTKEEHLRLTQTLEENARTVNKMGQYHIPKNTYVFGRICYCGYCGSMMSSTTGRTLKTGYKTSIFTCPRRRSGQCMNPSVSDAAIGDFVFNYIINMLHVKDEFQSLSSISELEQMLLRGASFHNVKGIEQTGLIALWDLLSHYKPNNSYACSMNNLPQKQPDSQSKLLHDKLKQETALKRLQHLYLYSGLSEKEYIEKKCEIQAKLAEIASKLGLSKKDRTISDAEFLRLASHLILSKRMKSAEVNYQELATIVSADVLKEYISTIIDKIVFKDGCIISIMFKNGLKHEFLR